MSTKRELAQMTGARRLERRVAAYFGDAHVVVAETFTPGKGWQRWDRYRKTVTWSWVRKLRSQGVTAVALRVGDRVADFTVAELLSAKR